MKSRLGVAVAAGVAALSISPARALALDPDPVAPVTPAVDPTVHGMGLEPAPQKAYSAAALADVRASAADAPASVDLTQWAVTPGNQGQVNSCAAWATGYSALGYYINRQGLTGNPLAPMYTYSQLVHGQNIGTYIDDHLNIQKTQGIDNQADYTQGDDDYTHTPTTAETSHAANWVLTSFQDLPIHMGSASTTTTQMSIESALADGEPVVLGIPVYANFETLGTTSHGYYAGASGAFMGNHAVTALGYDATGVRIENQWSAAWGDGGWATLSWAFVNQYVNQAVEVGPLVDSSASPKSLGSPVITGAVTRGSTLTSTTGRFTAQPSGYAYQWQHDSAGNGVFTNISGATDATYVTQTSDTGDKVRVNVTATNAVGSASDTSNAIGPIKQVAPTSTTAPVASGAAVRGSVVSATSGVWTDNPASYAYQWQRNASGTTWANIAGATTASYTLAVADENAKIRVNVTAKNSNGSGAAPSNELGPVAKAVASNADVPTITGTAARGELLTAATGTWAGIGNTFTYQWQRRSGSDYVNITGATKATYTVATADESLELRVKVTATNPDGAVSAFSAATAAVAKVVPSNPSIPAPAGDAVRTYVLTAAPGTWTGVGNTYTYQWQRQSGSDWVNIAGATKATYTLATVDEGLKLRIAVTAKNPDGTAVGYSATSGAVAQAPPHNTIAPTVTGTAVRAGVLSSTPGAWTNSAGITYAYQWQRSDGSGWDDIAGATRSTYTPTQADEGATVRIQVTGTNVDGHAAATSTASGTVAESDPANTKVPTISGTLTRLSKLTAAIGTWTGAGNTYAYQWQRQTGSDWDDIATASAATYTLADADTGHAIRVEVTGTNVDGHATAASAATTAIGKLLPTMTGAPAVSGTTHTGSPLTSTTGSWTPAGSTLAYQWQRMDGGQWTDIDDATGATYTLSDDDANMTVRVKVTATNADGSTEGFSKASATVLATPSSSAAPAVTGALTDASRLSASTGTWTSAGNLSHTYKYEWFRCPAAATTETSTGCRSLGAAGATATYTTVAADVTMKIGVRVTATNSAAVANTALSALTDAIQGRALTNGAAPAIAGTAMVKFPLTATAGTWSVPTTSVTYQWRRCDASGDDCADITGAKAATYTLAAADQGKTLVVHVSVASPGRTSTADSDATDTVAALALPAAKADPAVTGTTTRGQVLKATNPAWDYYPTAYAYQWERCDASGDSCADITGAKAASYTLAAADEGHTIKVTITATNTSGSAHATSDATGAVTGTPPVNSVAPSITGDPTVAKTLTAAKGTWATTTDTTYTYAWQRCDGSTCTAITGATAATYKVVSADVGHTIKVNVTATNPDGHVTLTAATAANAKAAAPAATVKPVLSGTAKVGSDLKITDGSWADASGTPSATFYRCSKTCTAVAHAPTYTLVTADSGFTIRASVTASGAGGTTEVYAAATLGPVKASTTGVAFASPGAPVSLKGSTGTVLAKATVSAVGGAASAGARTAGKVTVTVKPTAKAKGRYRVWACPTAAPGKDWQPCTAPAKLMRKGAHLKLSLDAGEQVQVVVAKQGR